MARTKRWTIPMGNAGHRVTVSLLQQLAYQGSQDPVLIGFARRATVFAQEKDPLEEAQGVLSMVQGTMRYTQDPVSAELVTDPRILVRQIESGQTAYGDCDDMATLTAAMLMAIGHPVRFVTFGRDPRGSWEHIYIQMYDALRNNWVSVDPIMKDENLGYSPPGGTNVAFGVMR